MSFDLTNKNIQDTFQNVLQRTGSDNHLYDLEGNKIGDLRISGSLIAKEYIVSSSVTNITTQQLSGSTQFGDSSDDSHNFTGNITASGNISSSGTINADKVQVDGTGVVSNIDSATQGQIRMYRDGLGSPINIVDLTTSGNPTFASITASGDISSSGNVEASTFRVDGFDFGGSNNTDQINLGHTNTSKLLIGPPNVSLTNITASGDISASGEVIGESATLGGFTMGSADGTIVRNLSIGSSLTHIGDIDTSIAFETEKITATADNIVFDGAVTASGDISSSGTINASQILRGGSSVVTDVASADTQGTFTETKGTVATAITLTDLGTTGNPTFNDITASGDVIATNLYLTDNNDIQFTGFGRGEITGSDLVVKASTGNITLDNVTNGNVFIKDNNITYATFDATNRAFSASSDLYVADDIFVGDKIEHINDSNTYISFADDEISLNASSALMKIRDLGVGIIANPAPSMELTVGGDISCSSNLYLKDASTLYFGGTDSGVKINRNGDNLKLYADVNVSLLVGNDISFYTDGKTTPPTMTVYAEDTVRIGGAGTGKQPTEKLRVDGDVFVTGSISSSATSTGSFGEIEVVGMGGTTSLTAFSSSVASRLTSEESDFTADSISGSLGTNADLIRSLTATGISGSFTALSSSLAGRVTTEEGNVDDLEAITLTAGSGMTGGGTLAGDRTFNVIGGDGITANANDMAITAAQTTIESIYKEDLVIGEDAETKIDFETADEIHFDVNNVELFNMTGNQLSGSSISTGSFGMINAIDVSINTDTVADGYALTVEGSISSSGDLYLDGNFDIDGNVTVGESADGSDVTIHGDTSGRSVKWDASENHLKLSDSSKIVFGTGPTLSGFDSSITHDGSNLLFLNKGGELQITPDDGSLRVSGSGTTEFLVEGHISSSEGFIGGTTQNTGSYDFPGAIVGYNIQGLNVGHDSYNLTTSYAVPDAGMYVIFVAPKSGIVEIEVQLALDMGFSSGTAFYLGLSDAASYNTLGVQYEQIVADPDENDDVSITHKWVIPSLTAGNTYQYWLGAKVISAVGTPKLVWGGSGSGRYRDFIMKATVLPSNTEIET